jgi:hypothetical protein
MCCVNQFETSQIYIKAQYIRFLQGMGANNSTQHSMHYRKLYFDPELDSSDGKAYLITDASLRDKFSELVEDERILEVRYYTHPFYGWEIMQQLLLHHAFIVFETDKWWWSIERNELGVTIQRSKKIEYVRDKYRRSDRASADLFGNGIQCEKKCERRRSTTVKELIDHIYRKDYLNQDYDSGNNNCRHFADKIYEFI